jgi:hypothetical protein
MNNRTKQALVTAPDGSLVSVSVTVCPPSRRRAAGSLNSDRNSRRSPAPQRGARWLAREAGLADVRKESSR